MKLLLDANLSRRLVPELAELYGEAAHVNTVGLPLPPSDTQIWDYAKRHGYIIVTQDADFPRLLEARGWPPKVALVRMGNLTREGMAAVLREAKPLIEGLHNGGHGLLEIARLR
jgi:predicted nuclease of predicted toxin-antitoxin system